MTEAMGTNGHIIMRKFVILVIWCGDYGNLLRKIHGTKIVPLGHRLMVRKTVPFGALFWCPFAKGH